jgi:hypothetical protein
MFHKWIRSGKDNLLEYAYISVFEPPVPSLGFSGNFNGMVLKCQHVQDPVYVTRNVLVRMNGSVLKQAIQLF